MTYRDWNRDPFNVRRCTSTHTHVSRVGGRKIIPPPSAITGNRPFCFKNVRFTFTRTCFGQPVHLHHRSTWFTFNPRPFRSGVESLENSAPHPSRPGSRARTSSWYVPPTKADLHPRVCRTSGHSVNVRVAHRTYLRFSGSSAAATAAVTGNTVPGTRRVRGFGRFAGSWWWWTALGLIFVHLICNEPIPSHF